MRRRLIEEPVTRAGAMARGVAIVAAIVAAIALVMIRSPGTESGPALAVLAGAMLLALFALVLAGYAFIRVWREGARGVGAAAAGVAIATMLLGYPAFAAIRGLRLPALSDVSTDTDEPPAFSRSRVAFAARDGNYPVEPGPETRESQRGAYPFIAPLTLDINAEEAFEIARLAAVNRKWQIVEAIRPGGRIGNGRIEAVARSRVLSLPADVTVRVRPRADGARIDVRSATRLGGRDFGDNSDRVRAYLDEVANLAIAAK